MRTSLRSLEQIVERETGLREQVSAAQHRAEAQLAEAHEAAKRIRDEGAVAAQSQGETAVQAVKQRADQVVADMTAQREDDLSALRQRLSANLPATISYIIDTLCNVDDIGTKG